jgi:hypothetical protein
MNMASWPAKVIQSFFYDDLVFELHKFLKNEAYIWELGQNQN